MVQIAGLIVLVAVVVFGWRHMTKQRKPLQAPAPGNTAQKKFHCVEIRKGPHACKAVQELGVTRYLSDEAPRLPVAGCTAAQCTCSFVHHEDRREDDRRNPYGQFANLSHLVPVERRARVERRKSQETTFKPSIRH